MDSVLHHGLRLPWGSSCNGRVAGPDGRRPYGHIGDLIFGVKYQRHANSCLHLCLHPLENFERVQRSLLRRMDPPPRSSPQPRPFPPGSGFSANAHFAPRANPKYTKPHTEARAPSTRTHQEPAKSHFNLPRANPLCGGPWTRPLSALLGAHSGTPGPEQG